MLLVNAALVATAAPANINPRARLGDDNYAAKAIRAGDFAAAERILQPLNRNDRDDPGRLINLARVHARTHRVAEARGELQRVARLPDEQVILDHGQTRSSTVLAAEMLTMLSRAK